MGCVYRLFNRETGLSYVGMTCKELSARWSAHCRTARFGCTRLISQAIREFGEDTWDVVLLVESDDLAERDRLERHYIAEFNTNVKQGGTGYNMTSGGQGVRGFIWSEESRDKKRRHCPVSRNEFDELANRMALHDLAQHFGVAGTTIYRWLNKFEITRRLHKQVYRNQNLGGWTDDDIEKLLKMYSAGESDEDIAKVLVRSPTAVRVKLNRVRKARGITRRRKRNQHQDGFTWSDAS